MEFKIPNTILEGSGKKRNEMEKDIKLALIIWSDKYDQTKNVETATNYLQGNKEFKLYCIKNYYGIN